MRHPVPVLLLVPLLACGASAPTAPSSPASPPAAPAAPSQAFTADDVFAALKARDPAKLSAVLDARPELAGAHDAHGVSALVTALFTLNADEETFVAPKENALLAAIAARHPPLDVYDAAATGDVARLRTLLAGDRSLANALHPRLGIGPLHLAAFAGSADAVALLLASGATLDLPSQNEFHNTPLILSLLADQYDTASALLAKGANVEAMEEGSVRPIHLAAELGDPRLIALLLDHRAALDAKTDDGKTALAIATERGHHEAARLLRERGAR